MPALIVALALTAACTPPPRPAAPMPTAARSSIPVVFMPGTTGTTLVDPSGRTIWGDTRSFFFPHDRGYALALPLDGTSGGLEPGHTILDFRLLGYQEELRPAYQAGCRARGSAA